MKTILCGLVLALAGVAWADAPTSMKSSSDDCAKQRRANNGVCSVNMEGENINDHRVSPLDENFHERRAPRHGSLISERVNFLPEMVKSLENL